MTKYSTLGARQSSFLGADLESGRDRKRDIMLDIKVEMIASNTTNAATIANLFKLESTYRKKQKTSVWIMTSFLIDIQQGIILIPLHIA